MSDVIGHAFLPFFVPYSVRESKCYTSSLIIQFQSPSFSDIALAYHIGMYVPINDDWIRRCVIFVATRSMLQTSATNQLMCQKNSTKIWIFASSFIGDQLHACACVHVCVKKERNCSSYNVISKTFAH